MWPSEEDLIPLTEGRRSHSMDSVGSLRASKAIVWTLWEPVALNKEPDVLRSHIMDTGRAAGSQQGACRALLTSSLVHTFFSLSWGSPKAFHSDFIFT